MKTKNTFFKKKKELYLFEILKFLSIKTKNYKNTIIENILDLSSANKKDITFFNSLKYLESLKITNSKFIITHIKYKKIVLKYATPIIVDNVLKAVADITSLFYPNSLNDAVDFNLNRPNIKLFKTIKFGKNVLIGENVKIGKNSIVGHNTIIESNVVIGSNCIVEITFL